MLKEIYEQPEVVQQCLNPCGIREAARHFFSTNPQFLKPDRIHILACGTSFHASLVGQYWFEQIANIPTIVRAASEFQLAPMPMSPNTLTIAVTQSGETADTIAAVRLAQSQAQSQAQQILAITNQAGSTITKLVDHTIVTPAGIEIGVAATKTFTAQLMTFYLLALQFADQSPASVFDSLKQLPTQIREVLQQEETIADLAQTFKNTASLIVLGSGINTAIALEGALKLKETTYIHAEGYAAGEFLHGPIALLDSTTPVIAIAPTPTVIKTIEKIKGSPIVGIASDHLNLWDHQITIPAVDEWLSPLLTVIPLQLLAYHIAKIKGLEVDRPRNLQKSLSS